jgi:phosphate transport system substrate-binding protein
MPNDFRVSITDAPEERAYPISSFTWLLVPAEFSDKSKLKAMKDFLQWMSTDGQKLTEQLQYATLPSQIVGPMDLWHINVMCYSYIRERKRRVFL